MIKVSVIIPVYNVEKYLRQCLESVANQTLKELEIICVDDGSTDGSRAILDEFAARDERFRIITREHTNAGAVRNAAMKVAKGEYLGFMDSDDYAKPTLFEETYNQAKNDDADVVSFTHNVYDERTGQEEGERHFRKEILELTRPYSASDQGVWTLAPFAYAPWARIVRRAFVEKEGIEFQECTRTNDVYFCCMVLALAKKLTLVDKVLYTYRTGTGSNLQARNSSTPTSVFDAWEKVKKELARRGILERLSDSLATASAGSFFYTLSTLTCAKGYCEIYSLMRRLYEEDEFFSKVTAENIANLETRKRFANFKRCDNPLDFYMLRKAEEAEQSKWRHARLNGDKLKLVKERDKLKAELAKIKASRTYKLGRLLLWPARVAKDTIKRMKKK